MRQSIVAFAAQMEAQLEAKTPEQGGFEEWPKALASGRPAASPEARLEEHCSKWRKALMSGDWETAKRQAVHIGNTALAAYETARELSK